MKNAKSPTWKPETSLLGNLKPKKKLIVFSVFMVRQ